MKKTEFKNYKYKKSRGGYSRLLDISCEKCEKHICFYQKDGPGMLKRMYLDRIYDSKKYSDLQNEPFKKLPQLVCSSCDTLLGVPVVYEKEDRLAYRLFAGSVSKKISKNK